MRPTVYPLADLSIAPADSVVLAVIEALPSAWLAPAAHIHPEAHRILRLANVTIITGLFIFG